MGSNGSKLAKKIIPQFNSSFETDDTEFSRCAMKMSTPLFVLSRKGSMFFDEDGDLAHEFFVEVPPTRRGCKATMKKVLDNLTPQGEVVHQFPRLHMDFPAILHHI